MDDQRLARRAVRVAKRAVVRAARRGARWPIAVGRWQLQGLAWGQRAALAGLGMQRATVEVVGDGAQRLLGAWLDRLARAVDGGAAR
jgi:hypothetical protein